MKINYVNSRYAILLLLFFGLFFSSNLFAQYCTPANLQSSNTNYISRVRLGNIDNRTNGTTGSYTDYSSLSTTNIKVGETINGKINIIVPGWNTTDNILVVWMNFNKNSDDDFEDSGERFLFPIKDVNTVSGNKIVTVPINIPIPATADLGFSRMRIGFISGNSTSFTSCDYSYSSGEVEDYKINFTTGTSSKPDAIIGDYEASYCTPTEIGGAGGGPNIHYISNVTLGSINKTTSGSNGVYTNYTSTLSTDLNIGKTITGSVSIKVNGNNVSTNQVIVWMNFNENDHDNFDEITERFVFNVKDNNNLDYNTSKTIVVPISIPVPTTAEVGLSRMRVAFRINSDIPYTACNFGYIAGEIEDYKINFIANTPPSDHDNDGIVDSIDLDDDNDGILDSDENNILSYGGFEYVAVPNNGNNLAGQGVNAASIKPWIVIPGSLGSGGTPNIVQVNGNYDYGNGGPRFDADINTNVVGFKQHYLDLNGNADIYQSFKITSTTDITYSGYFSPRDNETSATGKLAIYSGVGHNNTNANLIANTGTIAIPVQNGSSAATPWQLVQGTVTLNPGTYSFVVTISNNANFDEGAVKVTNSNLDTDGDGIANIFDLDSDNDGIFDADEAGHSKGHTNGVVSTIVGTDGIPDAVQISANSGTVNYVLAESSNDADFILNYLDIDSDGDGIPDNLEAQPTIGYIPPSNLSSTITDANKNGVDDVYEPAMGGIAITSLVDSDGDGIPDYLDTDSDNDGKLDITENGQGNVPNGIDSDNDGLDDAFDAVFAHLDVNDEVTTGNIDELKSIFGDVDDDASTGGDLNFRDSFDINPPSTASIYFNGVDDYLSRPSFINGLNDVTIMAWVKADTGNAMDMVIAGEDNGCKLWLQNGNKPKFTIKTIGNSEKTIGASSAIGFNKWYHITGSYSSSTGTMKLYVNGELLKTESVGSIGAEIKNTASSLKTFEIGRLSSNVNNKHYFKGEIDEVRVFNLSLSATQVGQMVCQELENNASNVRGKIAKKDIKDITTNSTLPWNNLIAYYPMTDIKKGLTLDYSSYKKDLFLFNIKTIQEQTAPMPYVSSNDGVWSDTATWLHENVWNINDLSISNDYCIVKISNNVTMSHNFSSLGLIIDADKTLTVQGDHAIANSWYLELNGTLDLLGDSQLIQTVNSDLVTSASGNIKRRQQGTSNSFRYNYWASPVGAIGLTNLSDNNAATNNLNNTAFKLNMLKDGMGTKFQFTSAYDQAGQISTYWLYTYINGVTYWDWALLSPSTSLNPGVGYTQKGTGNSAAEQSYIFEGKPNNGTILINVKDKGGPGDVSAVSKTEYLLGNPYPSALDIYKFIDDNEGVIDGKLQLWQQWAGDSHYLDEYKGGYAQVNKLSSVRAYQFVGMKDAHHDSEAGVVVPSRYLPVGQGFIAQIIANGTVVFNNSQRVFIKEADADNTFNNGSTFFKSANSKAKKSSLPEKQQSDNIQKIRLEFSCVVGPKTRREVLLGFSETTSDAYDYGYDAVCDETSNNDFNLNLEGKNMIMQAYGPITSDKVVPLNFKSSANNTFEIQATEFENMDESQEIYLKDNMTGIYFDLKQPISYRFSSAKGKFNTRFEMVFQSKQQSLSTEETTISENFIYYKNTTNTLYGKKLNTSIDKIAIVNMRGQTIMEFNNVSQETLNNGLKINNVSTGAYVEWVNTKTGGAITKKIIIN